MTIDQLKSDISDVLGCDGISAELYFLLKGQNGMAIKFADIAEDAQAELSAQFIQQLSNVVLLNDDLSLVNISSADDRKNAIYKYDLVDIPHQLTYLKEIIENEEFDDFSFADDTLSDLEGILVLIGNQEYQLALYKHQYPISLFKKDSGFNLKRIFNQNRFDKLDEDILKINSKFEFIKINGAYYIIDLRTLERFFGFHEAIKNVAIEGVNNIEHSGLIQDVSVLSKRLDDITFARKLVKAAKNSPVLGIIPNQDVIEFTNSHPALSGKIKVSADGKKLDLKTKLSQNLFMKLLNDDFLQSELTKRFYSSLAKDKIESSK